MTRVLFVDDEISILDGLRRSLRRPLKGWELLFADSGESALEILEKEPIDVLVSDMRMPGMDGAQLLKIAHDRWPKTIRLLLSGYSDSNAIMRSTLVAHQFMAKPCDSEELKRTVRNAIALYDSIDDPNVMKAVGEVEKLPPVPETYRRLTKLLASGDASLELVGNLVRRDPVITAKLLQLVNSAFFGLSRQVADPREAVNILGLDVVRDLVLTFGAFSEVELRDDLGPVTSRISNRCQRVAAVAHVIAPPAQADEARSAGLLLDVGQLIIASSMPDAFLKIDATCASSGRSRSEVEREEIGADHAAIGALLLSQWGLPHDLTGAVAAHHAPGNVDIDAPGLATWLHIADALVEEQSDGTSYDNSALDLGHLTRLGLQDDLDDYRVEAAAAIAGDTD